MFVHQVVLVGLSYGILVASVFVVRRLARSTEARNDLQRHLYLARRSSLIAVALTQLLGATVAVVLGVAFLHLGYLMGWGLFALAGVPLVFLFFTLHIARIPFSYPEYL